MASNSPVFGAPATNDIENLPPNDIEHLLNETGASNLDETTYQDQDNLRTSSRISQHADHNRSNHNDQTNNAGNLAAVNNERIQHQAPQPILTDNFSIFNPPAAPAGGPIRGKANNYEVHYLRDQLEHMQSNINRYEAELLNLRNALTPRESCAVITQHTIMNSAQAARCISNASPLPLANSYPSFINSTLKLINCMSLRKAEVMVNNLGKPYLPSNLLQLESVFSKDFEPLIRKLSHREQMILHAYAVGIAGIYFNFQVPSANLLPAALVASQKILAGGLIKIPSLEKNQTSHTKFRSKPYHRQ